MFKKKLIFLFIIFCNANILLAKENQVKKLFACLSVLQASQQEKHIDQQKVGRLFQEYMISLLKAFPLLCSDKTRSSWSASFLCGQFFIEIQQIMMFLAQSNIALTSLLTQAEIDALNQAMLKAQDLSAHAMKDFIGHHAT